MRLYDHRLLHSPSDLVRFLGCTRATALDRRKLFDPRSLPEKAAADAMTALVSRQGLEHEHAWRDEIAAEGELVEIPGRGSLETRAAATVDAMRGGARTIYQATFLQQPWHGFADFLVRVDEPSALGDSSYEPVDTKLARSVKPGTIVQLRIYADMIGAVQGGLPRHVHAKLGNGEQPQFRLVEFDRTLAVAKARYLAFVEAGAPESPPQPCAACSLCGWREHCDAELLARDDLSRVAGLSRPQAAKLREAGIETVAALALAGEDVRVPRLAPATFARLRAQAQLQVTREAGGEPIVEHLPDEPGRGFAQLPAPDPADLFFDLEGDPLTEGGLDYLWGVHHREAGEPHFRFRWGHDADAERVAFEGTIDWMFAHLAANPDAHVYHYAPYEITALRRLSTLHASREDRLDQLLRERRFVDLYGVLRQAIRTSEPNLSLKTMEVFFAGKRDGAVTTAGDSIVEYKSWQDTGDAATLQGILDYNKVDCENTEALRDWLISLRSDAAEWREVGPAREVPVEKSEERATAQAREDALIVAVNAGLLPPSPRGRALVGHLVQFHWRADKPAQWAIYDRCEREPDELVDDGECIGGLEPLPGPDGKWQAPVKRSIAATYRFPPQETKLRPGGAVLHAPTLMRMGTIEAIDESAGTVTVKRQLKADDAFPLSGSLIPGWPLSNKELVGAVQRVAARWAGAGPADLGDEPYRALLDLIERRPPRLTDTGTGPMVRGGESLVAAATARCMALDRSLLFIQGPPGTGKTYTSAHVIVALIAAGKRVGISSNGHKAINNLMEKVSAAASEQGVALRAVKKASNGNDDSYVLAPHIMNTTDNDEAADPKYNLVGGTAWLFARPEFDQTLDYLFVDEAGQVSLGHMLAMGAAARNIVLVGDQMQLGQPIQGAHPGESGLSVLDYLLEDEATVAPDRGILLDTSWRMHPEICGFISRAVYDGRLKAQADCARQVLHLRAGHHPALAPQGIRFVPADHEGCGQRSAEEVAIVRALVDGLFGTPFTDRDGASGTIGWNEILIVAPYNMQVNALRASMPQARVGTVDKFQGQEAEVVIVSLATSTPDDLPRHVEFFYSKNRLNVAISRARTLALVIANPKLLELDAKSVEHLRLVNTLAWVAEEGVK